MLSLWEAAEYPGYACTSLVRSSANGAGAPSDRAASARRALAGISRTLKPWQWSVIFHVLLMGETHGLYAFRVKIRPRLVTPRLRMALRAVADLQRGR